VQENCFRRSLAFLFPGEHSRTSHTTHFYPQMENQGDPLQKKINYPMWEA